MRGILFRPHPNGSQRLPGGRRGDWWISFHCAQQHRHRQKVGSRSQAMEQHGAIRRRVRLEGYCPNSERRTAITLEAFSRKYIETYSRANKASWRTDTNRLNMILPVLGKYTLDQLTPEIIEKYRRQRLAGTDTVKAVKPGTVTLDTHLIRSMYRVARDWGYTTTDPCKALAPYPKADARTQALSPDETVRLLAACSPSFRDIVIVALGTGLRRGRLLGLLWSQLDLKARWLSIPPTKRGRPVRVPLSDQVMAALRRQPRRIGAPGADYVFPNPATGRPYLDMKWQWRQAMKRAGLARKIETPWVDKRGIPRVKVRWVPLMRFHDLRSTFATRVQETVGDIITTQKLLGHADVRQTQKYAHTSDDRLKLAVGIVAP